MTHPPYTPTPVTSFSCAPLTGVIEVPGDKSISHRSLMLASQAVGLSTITGLLEGEDVLATAKALQKMGIAINRTKDGIWHVQGAGVGGLKEADDLLDMGNAGTGSRLMMGLVSTYPFATFFTGDASLRSRPMARVTKPLEQMGVQIVSRTGYKLPLAIIGTTSTLPITYTLPMPSAQVKSAILLAGLNTRGKTTVIEPIGTRDHTERMLRYFGAEVQVKDMSDGAKEITITGQPELTAKNIAVPGDPSSAAFLTVAALLIPGSHVTIKNICINLHRIGVYTTLKEMGADIAFTNQREVAGEEVADIIVKASKLKGITVPADRAPSMIDEYPILSVAAACAEGVTEMLGLEELKVKESNRLSAIAQGLVACGVKIQEGEDSLLVEGCKGAPPGGATIATHMDHRIAMSFLILGMVAKQAVVVDDGTMINTSFPGFVELMNGLGGKLVEGNVSRN